MLNHFYDKNQAAIDFILDTFSKWKPDAVAAAASDDALRDLADDPAFQGIAAATTRPNMFVATGNMTRESHHSNFLAWLLSPRESHGFEANVLRTLFPIFTKSCPEDIVVLREHVADLFDDEESAEQTNGPRGSRPDMLIYDPVARAVAVVEVKFSAKEGDRQLERYFQWAKRHFAAYHDDDAEWTQQLVFLTRGKAKPKTEDGGNPREFSVTNLSYDELSKELVPFAQGQAAGAGAVQDYLDFLAIYGCPLESIYTADAKSLLSRHEPALQALHRRRHALRREALQALAPDLAELGWAIDDEALATNTQDVRLQYLHRADQDSCHWHTECDELIWTMRVFVDGPPVIIGDLRSVSPECRIKWVERLGMEAGNPERKKRVLTVKLALPAQQRPFPLTTHNLPQLVDHLRVRLRNQVAGHIGHIRPRP